MSTTTFIGQFVYYVPYFSGAGWGHEYGLGVGWYLRQVVFNMMFCSRYLFSLSSSHICKMSGKLFCYYFVFIVIQIVYLQVFYEIGFVISFVISFAC